MNEISTSLFQQSILGVCVLALASVTVYLFKKLSELQEARRVDDKATLTQVLGVIEANTNSFNLMAEKIEAGKSARRNK